MADVFISYRRKGANSYLFASNLHLSLLRRGVTSFIDKEQIKLGDYNEKVLRDISLSKMLILIVSEESIKRMLSSSISNDSSLIELSHAYENNTPILPITLDGDGYLRLINEYENPHDCVHHLVKLHRLSFNPEGDDSIEMLVDSIVDSLSELGHSFSSVLELTELQEQKNNVELGVKVLNNYSHVVNDYPLEININGVILKATYSGETVNSKPSGFGTLHWSDSDNVVNALNGEWSLFGLELIFKGIHFSPSDTSTVKFLEGRANSIFEGRQYLIKTVKHNGKDFIRITNMINFKGNSIYLGERLFESLSPNFIGLNYALCQSLVKGLDINWLKLVEYANYVKAKGFTCPVTYIYRPEGKSVKRGYQNYIGEPIDIDDGETFKLPFLDIAMFVNVNKYHTRNYLDNNDYVSDALYRTYTINGEHFLVVELRTKYLVVLIVFSVDQSGSFKFNETVFIEVMEDNSLNPLMVFLNLKLREDNKHIARSHIKTFSILTKFKEHSEAILNSVNPVINMLDDSELCNLQYLYTMVGNSSFNNITMDGDDVRVNFAFYRVSSVLGASNPLYLKRLSFKCPIEYLEDPTVNENLNDLLVFKDVDRRIDFGYQSIL